ncbi:unnamed protein product [Lampetra planeri]
MAAAGAPRLSPIPLRGSRVPWLGEQSAARGDGVKGAAPRDGARSTAQRGGAGAERLRRTFIECDLDGDGYLSREDFKVAVLSLCGYKPSKTETDHLMASVKEKNLPGMPFDEFRRAVSTRLASVDFDDETRRIFTAFDTCCRGFLTVEDFRKAFSLVAPHLSGQTIHETFRETDRDLDGRVSYRDFETAMAARRGCRALVRSAEVSNKPKSSGSVYQHTIGHPCLKAGPGLGDVLAEVNVENPSQAPPSKMSAQGEVEDSATEDQRVALRNGEVWRLPAACGSSSAPSPGSRHGSCHGSVWLRLAPLSRRLPPPGGVVVARA